MLNKDIEINNTQKTAYPLTCFLLIIIILQGPIYWVPGINVHYWNLFKDSILVIFISIFLAESLVLKISPFSYLISTIEGKLLLLLLLLSTFGIFSGPSLINSFFNWIRILIAVLLINGLFLLFKTYPRFFVKLKSHLLVPIAISSIYILLRELNFIPLLNPPEIYKISFFEPHVAGFSYRNNAMAWATAFVWPICLFRIIGIVRKNKSFLLLISWILLSSVLIIATVITDARGGIVAIIVSVSIGILFSTMKQRIKTIFFVIILLGFVIFAFNLSSAPIGKRITLYLRGENLQDKNIDWDKILSGRLNIYESSPQIISKNFLFGVGLGEFDETLYKQSRLFKGPHNLYIKLAAEAGILSSLIALIFILYIIIKWTKFILINRDKLDQNVLICYTILITGFLNTTVESGAILFTIHNALPFWVSLAYLNVVDRHQKYGANENNEK